MNTTTRTDWIDNNMAPPVDMTLDQAHQVFVVLMGRAKELRKTLSCTQSATWDDFIAWKTTWLDINTLELWIDFVYPHEKGATPEAFKTLRRGWSAAQRRMLIGAKRMGVGNVLRGWTRRKLNPLDKSQRALIDGAIEQLSPPKNAEEVSEKLERRQFRRAEKHAARMNFDHAMILSHKDAQELPITSRRQARAQAEKLGLKGYAVMPHEDLGRDVLWYVSNRRLREDVWLVRQFLAEDDASAAELLDARYREAKKNLHSTAAHYSLFSNMIKAPRTARALIDEGMNHLSSLSRAWDSFMYARAAKHGIDRIEPWDGEYLCHAEEGEPMGAMPLDQTLRAAVGLLVPCAGFEVKSAKVFGTGAARRWCFDLQGANGPAQVWAAPFYCKGFINRDDAGFAINIRDRWHGDQTRTPVAAIQMTLAPTDRYIDWSNLRIFCHEMGHALHMLRLPGVAPEEMNEFPQDLVELPSQLMEMMAYDPAFLAKVSSASRATWAGFLRRSFGPITLWQRDLRAADADINAHMSKTPHEFVLSEFIRQRCEEKNLPWHPLDNAPISQFSWSSGYAGTSYTYPFNMAIAEELLTRRPDGTVDASATARVWKGLGLCHTTGRRF